MADSWIQVGEVLDVSVNTPYMAALSSTRVVLTDTSDTTKLRVYDFNDTPANNSPSSYWPLVDTFTQIGLGAAELETLVSPNKIFLFGQDRSETWRFDGADWEELTGGKIFISGGLSAAAGLNTTRVAVFKTTLAEIEAWDWDDQYDDDEFNFGSWTVAGNPLSVSSTSRVNIAAMSASRIAFVDDSNDELRAYDFNGTTWSLAGNALDISPLAGFTSIAGLTSSRIALVAPGSPGLRAYDFDGTDWTSASDALEITDLDNPALVKLSSTRVALVDSGTDTLRAYELGTWPAGALNLLLGVGAAAGAAVIAGDGVAVISAVGAAAGAAVVAGVYAFPGTQACPEDLPGHPVARLQYRYEDWRKGLHDIAIVIQAIMRGETNNGGCFCLDPNADCTTVQDRRIGAHGANASACARGANEFEVCHANNAVVRCFDYVIHNDAVFLTPINLGASTEVGNGTVYIPDG